MAKQLKQNATAPNFKAEGDGQEAPLSAICYLLPVLCQDQLSTLYTLYPIAKQLIYQTKNLLINKCFGEITFKMKA